jgi:hypothetical protein
MVDLNSTQASLDSGQKPRKSACATASREPVRRRNHPQDGAFIRLDKANPVETGNMGRGLLLWLLGIPLPIILVIWLLGGLS